MNLNDFSKWLQYNRVKNVRGSEYFPYPLYVYMYMCVCVCVCVLLNVLFIQAFKTKIKYALMLFLLKFGMD